jgi:Flp pilus assembly pilin Flp
MHRVLAHTYRHASLRSRAGERGSAAVEYVGLALVIATLMAAATSVVDSALGDKLAHVIVQQLVRAVSRAG